MKYEQIHKKKFPPETHTCVKELIISEGVHFLVLLFYSYYCYYHYYWFD